MSSLYEKHKLRIAGALNALGDVGLLIEGFASKSIPFKVAGWLYTAGAVVATFFGTPDKSHQVADLKERAAAFIETHNGEKSAQTSAQHVLKNRDESFSARITRSLRRYSGQIMLALYTAGAVAMLVHGVKSHKQAKLNHEIAIADNIEKEIKKTEGKLFAAKSTIGYGISSLTIKALSLLVKEDSTKKAAGTSQNTGVIGWFKEKPMRIFGYGSLITETMMGLRSYGQYKEYQAAKAAGEEVEKQNWGWSALTAVSYTASDLVIANTNKDAANAVGKLTEAEQEKVESMMAETISHLRAERRDLLIDKAADFLEKESLVNGSREELRASLLKRTASLWAERHQHEIKPDLQRA